MAGSPEVLTPVTEEVYLRGMIKIFIFAVVFFNISGAMAQAAIEVTIVGFEDLRGDVRVGLFRDERDFLKKAIEGKVVPITADSVRVIFDSLPPAGYAISVFHDSNRNGRLDTNGLGIPREGFAFGNNARGFFGPPSFDKAKVIIKDTTVRQVLLLKYF